MITLDRARREERIVCASTARPDGARDRAPARRVTGAHGGRKDGPDRRG
jgi:hypothetical protein